MNYKSYNDLSLTINKNIFKIPRDIDLVVGVPRLGMLPATMIGQILNKPVVALDSYIDGLIYEIGLYRRPHSFATNISEIKKVLIIDDSINSGYSMNKVKERIGNSIRRNIDTIYGAVYYVSDSLSSVDLGLEECLQPRIFQWNILNSWVLANACVDIDGVVCIDPTEEQNDDGDKYKNFLTNAKPLFSTEQPISCFVTTRLEKYRGLTKEWLKNNNLNYGELIMLDLPSKEERIKQNIHAAFKAAVYKSRKEELFIESNLSQAIQISKLTGKLVFCTENMEMIACDDCSSELHGKLNTPHSEENKFISSSPEIRAQGCEIYSTRIIKNFVNKCDLFIDVGANDGYYSLLVASASKDIKIIAIEPIAENFKVLSENFIHHNIGIERAKCINAAVSSSSGKINIYKSEASDNSSVLPHPTASTLEQVKVNSESLDDLLKNEQYKSLFIKLDTKGHEMAALEGLSTTFTKCDDITISLKMNPKLFKLAGTSCKEVIDYLASKGFSVFGIDDQESKFYPLEVAGNLEKLELEHSFFNALCVKKVKSLSVAFFSHSSNLAGAERSLTDLVEDLCNDAVLCSVILPFDGPLKDVLLGKGAAVYVLPNSECWWVDNKYIFNKEKQTPQLARAMMATVAGAMPVLRQLAPDVIYTQTIVAPWGALCAELLSTPHVLSVCEYGELDYHFNFYFGFRESIKALYDSSKAIFSITQSVKNEVFKGIIDKENKIEIVYRSVRLAQNNPLNVPPQNYDYGNKSEIKIAIFGTIQEGKGQEDIVRAGIELMKRGRKVRFYFFGNSDPKYLSLINNLIDVSAYKENFIIKDHVVDPIEQMKEMDIVVSCSRNEAFGRTLIEAILLDKPIVYSNSGGPCEIFTDEEHGLAYKCADAHSLAEKLLVVMDHPDKTRQRVKTAKEYVLKKFSRENYSGKIESRLKQIKGSEITKSHNVQALFGFDFLVDVMKGEFEKKDTERDGQIASLNQTVAERNGQIASLNQAVAERNGQITSLNQAVAEHDGQIAALYNSYSWRITRPLRNIAHQMKRIRRVAKLAVSAIKRAEGNNAYAKSLLKELEEMRSARFVNATTRRPATVPAVLVMMEPCSVDAVNDRPAQDATPITDKAKVKLTGWAGNIDSGTCPQEVFLELDGPSKIYLKAARGLKRPDVASHFNQPRLLDAGWEAYADLSGSPAGVYKIRVIQVEGQSGFVCDTKRSIILN